MWRHWLRNRIGLRNLVGALGVAASALLFAGQAHASGLELEQVPFRSFAHELLLGIGAADLSDIPAIGGYGKPRIAVLPFRVDEKVVPADIASEFNTRLMAELTRQGSGTYRFVARETLKSIIREIDTIAELDSGKDDRVAALMRNAQVDILIVGALRRNSDTVALSYKAVSVEDGTMFAATLPRQIDVATLRPVRKPVVPKSVVQEAPPPVPLSHAVSSTGRPTVHNTQRMLAQLGYRPGPIDGILHHRTRTAIRAFQSDHRLPADGRMTRQLVRELRDRARAIEARKSALVLP